MRFFFLFFFLVGRGGRTGRTCLGTDAGVALERVWLGYAYEWRDALRRLAYSLPEIQKKKKKVSHP